MLCTFKQNNQNRKCTYNYTECLSHNMKRSDLFNKQLNIEYIQKLCFVRLRDKYLLNLIWIIFSSAEYENYLFYCSKNFIYRLAHIS